jgi:hypothetical protein
MIPKFLLSLIFILSTLINIQGQNWEIFYFNNQINLGSNTQHQLHYWNNGRLLLVEKDYSGIYENEKYVSVKSYAIDQWNGDNFSTEGWENVGQILNLNQANNEDHVDFVISPDGTLYLGMKDTIFSYNSTVNQWIPTFLPNYIGGLSTDESGTIYFLETTDAIPHHFKISRLTEQGAETVASIQYELPWGLTIYPRIVNQANQIIARNNMFYVSVARASTNQNYYFTGNSNDGFTMLPEHFTHLNLSSMLLTQENQLIIAYRDGTSPYHLIMKEFDFAENNWTDFPTDGINIGMSSYNHLKQDADGYIYMVYHGPINQGYLYQFNGTSWQHIGNQENPTHTTGPYLTFDENNQLYLAHGTGAIGDPLTVRRLAEPTNTKEQTRVGELQIFPNPAKDHIYVKADTQKQELSQLIIRDAAGKMILEEKSVSTQFQQINLSALKPGMYIVEIISKENNTLYQQKLVVY